MPEKYNPWALSEEEKKQFVAALMDGFDRSGPEGGEIESLSLPATVKAGLLRHPVYYDKNTEYNGEELEEFWQKFDEDLPLGLFAQLPINFCFLSLGAYFGGQMDAYLKYAKSDKDLELEKRLGPEFRGIWDRHIFKRALAETYSKPWYEYHITEKFGSLIAAAYPGKVFGPAPNMKPLAMIESSARLGRLIEQYYWKFLVERSAISGAKSSDGAKSGGHAKASKKKPVHAEWRHAARVIWQENPTSPITDVARKLKKRLRLTPTEKQICRVIRVIRPK